MDIISAAFAAALACQQPNTDALIGLWESDRTSRGGIGHNIEFHKDGSYNSSMVVMVDLLYDIKDGKLFTSPDTDEPVSYEQGTTVTIEENSIKFIGEDGEVKTKNRLSNDSSSIIGQYKYRHYTGAIAYEQYTTDGLLKLRIPMSADGGCYSIEKNNLSMIKQNESRSTIQFKVLDNALILTNKEKTYSYNFVTEGAWYKSDEIDYRKPIK